MRPIFFLILLSLAVPTSAAAQILGPAFDTQAGGRDIGLGRAFSAIADDPSAVRINPAGITQAKAVSLGVMYQHNESPSVGYDQYTYAVVDSKTSQLAMGLSYAVVSDNVLGFIGNNFDEPPPFSFLTVALGDSGMQGFHFGLALEWLRVDSPVVARSENDFNLTVGGLIPLKEYWGLQIGVVGRHLLGSDRSTIADPRLIAAGITTVRFLPREFEASAVATPFEFLRAVAAVKFDYSSNDDTGMGYSFGGEVEVVKQWRGRAGFHRDAPTGDHFIAGGMGFEGTEGALIYAYERNLSRETNQHTVSIFFRWL